MVRTYRGFVAAAAFVALLGAAQTHALDQGISGKKLLLKTGKLVLISKDTNVSATGYDPINGADSSISFNDGSGAVIFDLPKTNWSTNGAATLFKYKNTSAPGGPSVVKIVKIKSGLLKVVAKGLPFAVANGAATIDVVLNLDGGTTTYCMTFAGTGDGSKFLAKNAVAGTCAADAACGVGLVCRPSSTLSASCRAAGTGAQGEPCGVAGDAACGVGLVCRPRSYEPGHPSCDAVGTGTTNEPCNLPGDAPCDSGLVCRFYSDFYPACGPAGAGTLFEPCGMNGDAACGGGLVCRHDSDVGYSYCADAGTGAENELCGASGDAACAGGLVCRPNANGLAYCLPAGTGTLDEFCEVTGDTPCAAGLVCRHFADGYLQCEAVGTGTEGEACGETGDALCAAGLVCRVDYDYGYPFCDTPGTGTTNEGCGAMMTPPPAVKRVFLTAGTYFGGNFGGLAGADAICQQEASFAFLSGTYKAWLSDSTHSAASRLTQSEVPYVRVDDTKIADDWTDLTDTEINVPISLTAWGAPTAAIDFVWTGSSYDGSIASDSCQDWTSSLVTDQGWSGQWSSPHPTWSDGFPVLCNTELPLYCFEQ